MKYDIDLDGSPLLGFFARIMRPLPQAFKVARQRTRSQRQFEAECRTSENQSTKKVDRLLGLNATDSDWLSMLVFNLFRDRPDRQEALLADTYKTYDVELDLTEKEFYKESARELVFLFSRLEELGAQFNQQIAGHAELKMLTITGTGFFANASERKEAATEGGNFHRCRITCGANTLVLKSGERTIDVYLTPSSQLFLGTKAETNEHLKAHLVLCPIVRGYAWSFEGAPTTVGERVLIMRSLFRDLVLSSKHVEEKQASDKPAIWNAEMKEQPSIDELLQTKLMLIRKLVNRQEEITNAIARDLHDVVIADIMLLKRRLSEGSSLKREEIIAVLDRVSREVREISYNLSPRDLDDWGLSAVLEDLLERVRTQTNAHCTFTCTPELPQLERDVQLQIFRMVQESLNNAAKHANAEQLFLSIEVVGKTLRVMVMDDGDGFDIENLPEEKIEGGGTGLTGLRERAELIRCFHPVTLTIESKPGTGTNVLLEISCGGSRG